MVLILDDNSGVHVRSNICYLICLRHLVRSKRIKNRMFFLDFHIFPTKICLDFKKTDGRKRNGANHKWPKSATLEREEEPDVTEQNGLPPQLEEHSRTELQNSENGGLAENAARKLGASLKLGINRMTMKIHGTYIRR